MMIPSCLFTSPIAVVDSFTSVILMIIALSVNNPPASVARSLME